MTNKEIAYLLRTVATVILLKSATDPIGNIRFRIMAYDKAAETIEGLAEPLEHLIKSSGVFKIPGIGATIGSALKQLVLEGKSDHFNGLLEGIPPTVFALMEVPGIGPKKAHRLVMQFELFNGIKLFETLKKVCTDGSVAELDGFGQKSQADILAGIALYEKKSSQAERILISEASKIAAIYTAYLNKYPGVRRTDVLGSLRRRVSTIGDIDIAVIADDANAPKIVEYFLSHPRVESVAAKGDAKASIYDTDHLRIDLRVQEEASYGSMLQYFTGSKQHNIALREHALKREWSLNEYGLSQVLRSSGVQDGRESGVQVCRESDAQCDRSSGVQGGGESASQRPSATVAQQLGKKERDVMLPDRIFSSEEQLYSFLGLQYIPPELREGNNEIDAAKKNTLPHLIELQDIQGDLHMHCSYDFPTSHDLGKNSPRELGEKAKALNYSYIGITDHNPRQKGLSTNEIISVLKARKAHIDQEMRDSGIAYFIGLEVDILPTGEIALPHEAIEYVDYLIVSVHSSFTQDRSTMTKRVFKALAYPKVKIFGHPTGRLINQREGVDIEWSSIFEYVSEHDIALEINASPSRLDLPEALVREATKHGVKFTIDTDAHATEHMDNMQYGIDVARRGWLTKDLVKNTLSYSEFKKWLLK